MLNGEWDDETFQKFSWYDGVNLNMMRGYEKETKRQQKMGSVSQDEERPTSTGLRRSYAVDSQETHG